tara:strand:+ start:2164 stop:2358 length:195 start_codon:yes stop_codon:yes gene_type:complete
VYGGIMSRVIDRGIEKILSRKLLVWITATALAYNNLITSEDWVIISGLYLGGQAIIDAVVKVKG